MQPVFAFDIGGTRFTFCATSRAFAVAKQTLQAVQTLAVLFAGNGAGVVAASTLFESGNHFVANVIFGAKLTRTFAWLQAPSAPSIGAVAISTRTTFTVFGAGLAGGFADGGKFLLALAVATKLYGATVAIRATANRRTAHGVGQTVILAVIVGAKGASGTTVVCVTRLDTSQASPDLNAVAFATILEEKIFGGKRGEGGSRLH